MVQSSDFNLTEFTPYMLAMAAETAGAGFQKHYKARYGMLRNEWRVLFHLGRNGPMSASDVCSRARLHKTKVSRAVAALEDKRFLKRERAEEDRRRETLSMTKAGQAAFDDLSKSAAQFEEKLMDQFSIEEREILHSILHRIANL